jgi:hypothetical protein
MVGLELVGGYLAAWAVRKARRVGKGLDEETDDIIDAGLNRLHDTITAKLGTDPALARLEDEAASGAEPGERTLRRVQDAIEDAADDDPQFARIIQRLLSELEEAQAGSPGTAGIDLRNAKGVQLGSHNFQANTFH